MQSGLELYCTLLPSMDHFGKFADDPRLRGVRLNTPMLSLDDLQTEFDLLKVGPDPGQVFFDVKGRQVRVIEVVPFDDHLEVMINHPIAANPGSLVLFKAGGDPVLLQSVADDGYRLIFDGGPYYKVKPGESFHVVDPSFRQGGVLFNDWERARIELAKQAGINRWLLSYTESQRDVDEFLELVGDSAEVWLKIENNKGLAYVEQSFVKRDGISLIAARGDLYVELRPKPSILQALQMILEKDPEAIAGSRILLSVINDLEPSCADLSEVAWLREIGYRRFMLCDELCLHGDMLLRAVDAFEAVVDTYQPYPRLRPSPRSARILRRGRR